MDIKKSNKQNICIKVYDLEQRWVIENCITITDHEADLEVRQEDQRDDEDADHGEGEVPPQFEHDDLVGLPRGVNLEEEAGEGEI